MSEAHIRDVLAVTRDEMKQGKVSTRTMCELDDPRMNTLKFADPRSVVNKTIDHPCERCRNAWVRQSEDLRDQAKAKHKFRKTIHKTNSMQRFGMKKSRIIH